jgi:hypothetical protein
VTINHGYPDAYDAEWDDEDDDDEFGDERDRTHCGGEGWDECIDVLAGCGPGCQSTAGDAYTYCPCRACDGTGLRKRQRVF